MITKQSFLLWWLPLLILCFVFYPMNFAYFTVYVEFILPIVGWFALWLFATRWYATRKFTMMIAVYALLVAIYNPISSNYSLAMYFALKNYNYLVVVNLMSAFFFLYAWWTKKDEQ